MGTSTSAAQLAGKLNAGAKNMRAARKASFRTAEHRMQPRFRDAARAAAGGDRRLSHHRSNGQLDAKFKVTDTEYTSLLYINAVGPWGIRDNTDVGGRTAAHSIRARGKVLKFMGYDGIVYRRVVDHPGSNRSAYWGRARETCWPLIQKRVPEETIRALEAALSGSGFASRG